MKKTKIIWLCVSIPIFVLVCFAIYFFALRTPIDAFSCFDVETSGVSGAGQAELVWEESERCLQLQQMDYQITPSDGLTNASIVTVSVNPTQMEWFLYHLKPVENSKDFEINNLGTMPLHYDDLTNEEKDQLSAAALVEGEKRIQSIIEYSDKKTMEKYGETGTVIDTFKYKTFFRSENVQECLLIPEDTLTEFNCASVVYIYEDNKRSTSDAFYYLSDAPLYRSVAFSEIYRDKDGQLHYKIYTSSGLSALHESAVMIERELSWSAFQEV